VEGGAGVIADVDAWEVLDSRGRPTVACEVRLRDGSRGSAAVPSGASTGGHEAHESRDGDPARYGGRGVLGAVARVRDEIASAVVGLDARDQAGLDNTLRTLDGTAGLSRLGANAVLAVSVATALAAADSEGIPLWRYVSADADAGADPLLPMPMVNIISGGAHAGGLIDVQDLLVVPLGATSFAEALEWSVRVRAATADVAAGLGLPTALVADEGGISGTFGSNRAALECLARGIERSGLTLGTQAAIAIDVAANQLAGADGTYQLAVEDRALSREEFVAELAAWCADFPVVSLEDVLSEDDWSGWTTATTTLAGRQLLGDDLFATDLTRLDHGIECGAANAVLVKPNQTGTLSSAASVVARAHSAGYATVLSARSGETEDSWLADLAVGWRTGQLKVGSTTRSERTAKWNRLLRIEHQLGPRATFARQVL
jgi:enolase